MTLDNLEQGVRRLGPLLIPIALVVGIVLGLILGWQVWPVSWYDTDPSDLRVEHQKSYVLMTADSLMLTGNVEVARKRLAELQDQDTSWAQVADLVERVALERDNAGDAASALRVRRLAQVLQLPTPTSPFRPPSGHIRFTGNALLALIIVLILLGIIAAAILYWRSPSRFQRRPSFSPSRSAPATRTQATRPFSFTPSGVSAPFEAPSGTGQAEQVGLGGYRDLQTEGPRDREGTPPAERPALRPVADAYRQEPEQQARSYDLLDEDLVEEDEEELLAPEEEGEESGYPTEVRPIFTDRVPEARPGELPADVLGNWEADYAFGDNDFDCSFTIETPDKEFLGECGVGMGEMIPGGGPQKVVALEVWLFDKGDIRTVRQIVVSEYAYDNPTLSAKLAEKGDLVLAQPGAVISLETLSLLVTATIKECGYADDAQLPNTYFSNIKIELVAEKSDQLS